MQTIEHKGRPARVLLVEDNYGDVILARRAFESIDGGSEITVASTGEKAISMLKREGAYAGADRPDLVLLDLNLPRMKGQDVLNAIKNEADLMHIPVVVMSSSRFIRDVLSSYRLHANGYVIKPDTLEAYRDTAEKLGAFWFTQVIMPGDDDVRH